MRSNKFVPVLFILTIFCSSVVADNCYVDCMDASGCWYSRSDENVSYCSGTQARCSTECRNAEPKKSYGAIAYGIKDEAYGWSHGWNDQEKAEQVALKNCAEHGSDCEIQVWFYNSCAAVAADAELVTWGLDDSEKNAQTSALDKCTKAGGANCTLKTSHCSR